MLSGEALNSALESLVDLHTREFRREARAAKDAGAVLALAAGSVLVCRRGAAGELEPGDGVTAAAARSRPLDRRGRGVHRGAADKKDHIRMNVTGEQKSDVIQVSSLKIAD